MEYIVVPACAFAASMLTFFSGFGLGTLLLPAFAVFFPIDLSIALTAIVHLLNNLFKIVLIGRHIDRSVVLRFGLPAIAAAWLGAWLLLTLGDLSVRVEYQIAETVFVTSPIRITIASLMIVFAFLEWSQYLERVRLDARWLPVGGVLSGFFGGLSGHQGALRSAFLLRCNLSKEGFIATGVALACLIDFTRMTVYSGHITAEIMQDNALLIAIATIAGFAGVFAGSRLLEKITMLGIQRTVAAMLFLIAIGIAGGWI